MHTTRNLLLVWIIGCAALFANSGEVPLVFIANQAGPGFRPFHGERLGTQSLLLASGSAFSIRRRGAPRPFRRAAGAVAIEGLQQLAGRANFLIGPEEEWRVGVRLYGGIVYRDLYPGIDMLYGGLQPALESL